MMQKASFNDSKLPSMVGIESEDVELDDVIVVSPTLKRLSLTVGGREGRRTSISKKMSKNRMHKVFWEVLNC